VYGSTTADVVLEETLRFKIRLMTKKIEDDDSIRSIYRLNRISIRLFEKRTKMAFMLSK
jgi:hypothetical protein